MKTVGKIILAVVLAYVGLMLASFVGGTLAGMLGVLFTFRIDAAKYH
jgi:hypothetical protein